ncbi:LOW QUALITY PROTEIN: hypothetical protein NC652_019968 [Populus alba x Populus x berolinensis]|nr:LOW QUALITY PROTEIN: hypothetical protein NC652_019968 [Populus alba x Populus x berolinensis]
MICKHSEAENLQCNHESYILQPNRFCLIIGVVIAGILGFTGLTGFVLYFLVMAITSVALIAKAKFSIHTYFDSWNRVVFDGFLGGLMSFVLFWTGRTRVLLGTDTRKHMRQGSCSVLNGKEAPLLLLLHIYTTFELKYGFNAFTNNHKYYLFGAVFVSIVFWFYKTLSLGLTTLGKPLLIQFCMNTALSLLVGSNDNNLLS